MGVMTASLLAGALREKVFGGFHKTDFKIGGITGWLVSASLLA